MLSSPSSPDPAAWLRGLEVAHRGLHGPGIPENSPSAFAAAVARGLAIECDVQLTADGEAVVFHDFALERLTGQTGPVIARTAAELRTIPLTGSDDRIPSLADMLAQVAARTPILIELKSRKGWPAARLCAAVERTLASYDGPVAVMSFDPRVSRWFAAHAPARIRGLVLSEYEHGQRQWGLLAHLRQNLTVHFSRTQFLAVDVRGLPGPIAAAARKRGLPIATWTVRTPAQRRAALAHADAPIAEGQGVP
jgi:glycerophosphoryl diester phosphodiesterase